MIVVTTFLRSAAIALAGAVLAIGVGGTAYAHDDIAGSTPPSGAIVDDPISEVVIDFGEGVGEVEMILLDPDEEVVDGTTTTIISETEARIDFPELDRQGVYIVRYLAPVTNDGHLLAGAISFTYGGSGGSSNVVPILLFCGFAIVVLSIGAWFSWRRYQALRDAEVDDELADAPA